jgi:hypothetical protein
MMTRELRTRRSEPDVVLEARTAAAYVFGIRGGLTAQERVARQKTLSTRVENVPA